MGGPINQIVYNQSKATSVIAFQDILILSYSTELMKRQYWLKNAQNKPEIKDRIIWLGSSFQKILDYYRNRASLTWQYPLMILTDTKKIFLRRFRRSQKMISDDNSSDGDVTPSSEYYYNSKSIQILNNLEKNSLEYPESSIYRDNVIFDDELHDIYKETEDFQKQKLEIEEVFSHKGSEKGLDNLIIEFNDVDPKKTIENFCQLKKKITTQGRQSLYSLDEEISPNIFFDESLFEVGMGKIDRATEMRRIQRKKWMYDRRKTIDNRVTKDKEHNSKKTKQILPGRNYPEGNSQETQKIRRPKIRDKATELLNRVKSQDYTTQDQ